MTSKPKTAAPAKAPGKDEEVKADVKVEAPTTAKDKPQIVKVRSTCKEWLRQPSSGLVINAKAEAELRNDGWLENQITAGFLELV